MDKKLLSALVWMCVQFLESKDDNGMSIWWNRAYSAAEETLSVLDELGCLKNYNGVDAVPDWDMINALLKGEIEFPKSTT